MKASKRIPGLLILFILVFNNSMAQKASFTTNGGLTIGFGAGETYQRSDLANSNGLAFDFILGSQLYKKENAFLSLDWKFRFMAGENMAFDHRINADDTYSNIQYKFNNYDLELGLTLNRLRERTGIILTGFAGAGVTHGRTFTDLFDAGNNLYDYSTIVPNPDSKLLKNDLISLSDGNFETSLVNKAAILPTAGFYIGYQISSSFALGIEFKSNFYLTEDNSIMGINLDNRSLSGTSIDRNNYASLGLKWAFGGGSSSGSQISAPPVVTIAGPTVNFTEPAAESFQTTTYNLTIKAIVNNVTGPGDISFFQNGYPNNRYSYNVSTKVFSANVQVRDGENTFKVKATNQTASAEDLLTITYGSASEEITAAPTVRFSTPMRRESSTSSENLNVSAYVKNISGRENIQVQLNGDSIAFELDEYTGLVKSRVLLREGENILFIKGSNEAGQAEDQRSVIYTIPEAIPAPSARFTNPSMPLTVQDSRFPLRAETQNVFRRNDVRVDLNGVSIGYFTFSAGVLSSNLLLSEGLNTIEIFASNETGTATDRTSITYNRPVVRPAFNQGVTTVTTNPVVTTVTTNPDVVIVRDTEPVVTKPVTPVPVVTKPCLKPEIRLIDPAYGEANTRQQSFGFRAGTKNVANSYQLGLSVNGKEVRFSYRENVLSSTLSLASGVNTISLIANNECGEANATARIIYAPPVAEEPVVVEPVVVEPVVVVPVVEEPVVVEPVVVEPVVVEPVIVEPVVVEPVVVEPVVVEPIVVEPIVVEPVVVDPVVVEPVVVEPVVVEPVVVEPVVVVPVVVEPVVVEPVVVEPVVVVPVVVEPLVVEPIVVEPIVVEPIVVEPIVVEPVEEAACGVRINPGNSAWQFCLVTASGTFTRDNLQNNNFSYSGSASSLYFKPIGGGGDAIVNGQSYTLRSGQYYLFTGNLDVTVSTSNPGSMGHWSVCISSNSAPITGNGNNRPTSPCEENDDESEDDDDDDDDDDDKNKDKTNQGKGKEGGRP